ncbi:MAG: cupin domain-containing protein [Halofilum sp. (in: g-proteobacteria)]|nr:cupin domain-containing protein [Halofilum sp. (in: g-proteobacteria)]
MPGDTEPAATGDAFRITHTEADTGGAYVRAEAVVRPLPGRGAQAPAPTHRRWFEEAGPTLHVHPGKRERIEVLEGRYRVRVGRRVRTLEAGESIDIPAGRTHAHWNGRPARAHRGRAPPGHLLRRGVHRALPPGPGRYRAVERPPAPAPAGRDQRHLSRRRVHGVRCRSGCRRCSTAQPPRSRAGSATARTDRGHHRPRRAWGGSRRLPRAPRSHILSLEALPLGRDRAR